MTPWAGGSQRTSASAARPLSQLRPLGAGECLGDDRITRVVGVQLSQIGEALVSAPPAGQALPNVMNEGGPCGPRL